jgi:hypothetical protein
MPSLQCLCDIDLGNAAAVAGAVGALYAFACNPYVVPTIAILLPEIGFPLAAACVSMAAFASLIAATAGLAAALIKLYQQFNC